MNKLIIGFVLIVIAIAGWLLYKAETADYVEVVKNEVNHLESELGQYELLIEQGELTLGAATVMRARLISQLNIIRDTIELAEVTHVSKEQELLLLKSLEQLEWIVGEYKGTIDIIEKTASANFVDNDPSLDSVLGRLHDLIVLLNDHLREVVSHADLFNESDKQ